MIFHHKFDWIFWATALTKFKFANIGNRRYSEIEMFEYMPQENVYTA